jgi:ammonium transporter Rh
MYYQASDVGSSMFVHVFGAYFGLAVSFVLYRGTAYCADRQSRKDEANSDSIGETLSTAVGITHNLSSNKFLM